MSITAMRANLSDSSSEEQSQDRESQSDEVLSEEEDDVSKEAQNAQSFPSGDTRRSNRKTLSIETATMQTWRKAYGALKDQTKVGLAHVNSDFKDVDVAIVKATNHVECPPKERHIRKVLAATSAIRPRADVQYCLHALARRLAKTRNWTVALKTLIVIHRALREGDPTFREELLNFQQRGHVLQLANFKDDSSPIDQ